MVDEDRLEVRVCRGISGEDRYAVCGVGVRGIVDLEVVDGEASLLERIEDALRPLTASRLSDETPDQGPIA